MTDDTPFPMEYHRSNPHLPYTEEDHQRFLHAIRLGHSLSPDWVTEDRHYRWLQKFAAIGMDLTPVSPGKYMDASKVIEVTYNGYWRVCGKGNGHLRGKGITSLKKFAASPFYRHLLHKASLERHD